MTFYPPHSTPSTPALTTLLTSFPNTNVTVEARLVFNANFPQAAFLSPVVSYQACLFDDLTAPLSSSPADPKYGANPGLTNGNNNFLLYRVANRYVLAVAGAEYNSPSDFYDPANGFPDTEWHSVSATFSILLDGSSEVNFYYNGTWRTSFSRSASHPSSKLGIFSTGLFALGQELDSCNSDGSYGAASSQTALFSLDEIRLWSTLRTPAEIQASAFSSVLSQSQSLYLLYTFDAVLPNGVIQNLGNDPRLGSLRSFSDFYQAATVNPTPPSVSCSVSAVFVSLPTTDPSSRSDFHTFHLATTDIAAPLLPSHFSLSPPSATIQSITSLPSGSPSTHLYAIRVSLTTPASRCASPPLTLTLLSSPPLPSLSSPSTCALPADVSSSLATPITPPALHLAGHYTGDALVSRTAFVYPPTYTVKTGTLLTAYAYAPLFDQPHTITLHVSHTPSSPSPPTPLAFATFPPSSHTAHTLSYSLPSLTASTPTFSIRPLLPGTLNITLTSSLTSSYMPCLVTRTYLFTIDAADEPTAAPVLLIGPHSRDFYSRYEADTYPSCSSVPDYDLFWLESIRASTSVSYFSFLRSPSDLESWLSSSPAVATELSSFFEAIILSHSLSDPSTPISPSSSPSLLSFLNTPPTPFSIAIDAPTWQPFLNTSLPARYTTPSSSLSPSTLTYTSPLLQTSTGYFVPPTPTLHAAHAALRRLSPLHITGSNTTLFDSTSPTPIPILVDPTSPPFTTTLPTFNISLSTDRSDIDSLLHPDITSITYTVTLVTSQGTLAARTFPVHQSYDELSLQGTLDVTSSLRYDPSTHSFFPANFSNILLPSHTLPPSTTFHLQFDVLLSDLGGYSTSSTLSSPFIITTPPTPPPPPLSSTPSGRKLIIGGTFTSHIRGLDTTTDTFYSLTAPLETELSTGSTLGVLAISSSSPTSLSSSSSPPPPATLFIGGDFSSAAVHLDLSTNAFTPLTFSPSPPTSITTIPPSDFLGHTLLAGSDSSISMASTLSSTLTQPPVSSTPAPPPAPYTASTLAFDDGSRHKAFVLASSQGLTFVHVDVNTTTHSHPLVTNGTSLSVLPTLVWDPSIHPTQPTRATTLLSSTRAGTLLLGRSYAPYLTLTRLADPSSPSSTVAASDPSSILDGPVLAIQCIPSQALCYLAGDFTSKIALFSSPSPSSPPQVSLLSPSFTLGSSATVYALAYDPYDGTLFVAGSIPPSSVPSCPTCEALFALSTDSYTPSPLGASGPDLGTSPIVRALALTYTTPPLHTPTPLHNHINASTHFLGDLLELTFALPSVGPSGTLSAQAKLHASSSDGGSVIIGPDDWVFTKSTRTWDASGLFSFAVRVTNPGTITLTLYVVSESDTPLYAPSVPYTITALPRPPSAPPISRAALFILRGTTPVPFSRTRNGMDDPGGFNREGDSEQFAYLSAAFDPIFVVQDAVVGRSPSVANPFDAVVVAESVSSGDVGSRYLYAPIPVSISEGHLYDDLRMADTMPAPGRALVNSPPGLPSAQVELENLPGGKYKFTGLLRVPDPVTPLATTLFGPDVQPGDLIRISSDDYMSINVARALPSAEVAATTPLVSMVPVSFRYSRGAEMFDCVRASASRTGMFATSSWTSQDAVPAAVGAYAATATVDLADITGVNGVFWGTPGPSPPPPPIFPPPPPPPPPSPPPVQLSPITAPAEDGKVWLMETTNLAIVGGFVLVVLIAALAIMIAKRFRTRQAVHAHPSHRSHRSATSLAHLDPEAPKTSQDLARWDTSGDDETSSTLDA